MQFRCQLSLAVVASSVALCVTSNPAQANPAQANPAQALTVPITVDGTTYNVTTFTGTYDGNVAKFNTLANNGLMPWWGSQSLASTFASQISTQLGLPNATAVGPNFAYQALDISGDINVESSAFFQVFGFVTTSFFLASDLSTYATASPVSVPAPAAVPGPLPIFGAAAAFGMSRRLRHRILLNA